ncbi:hypothetical protein DFH09DRAFT_1345659 [Mycena vulgaris]|nr:hypothetical protein DFH09DRAFT_1345659 [Mycena vulgaris]
MLEMRIPAVSSRLATCLPPTPSESSVDLARLLTSNDVPKSSEITSVLHVISNSQAQIDLLEPHAAQMESLQTTLVQLSRQRDEAAEFLHKHRNIISPVRRIPEELLCEIFSLTLPWYRRVNGDVVHQPSWRLGHVCARWRGAAINYSPLWRFLDIGHSSNAPEPVRYPLSFGLPICPSTHSNRWATVQIPRYRNSPTLRGILRRVSGQLPALQTLKFCGWRALPEIEIADYFSVAPALREVILADSSLSGEISHTLPIPWNQITRYRGVYTPIQQFQILRDAPNLVECELGFDLFAAGLMGNELVTLPYLRRLESTKSGFLDHLQLPSLEALFLQDNAKPVLSLLRRSSCHLTKLVLMSCDIPPDFPTILRCIPTLTYLFLESAENWRKPARPLLKAMTLSGTPSDLCPNLTSFVFARCVQFSSENTLIAMDETPPAALLARLQRLGDDGLDVAFLSDPEDVEELKEMVSLQPY